MNQRSSPSRPKRQLRRTARSAPITVQSKPMASAPLNATAAAPTTSATSILDQRKGYQNPSTLANELRVLQAQTHMSLGDIEQDALALSQRLKSYGAEVMVASSGGLYTADLRKIETPHAQVDLHKTGLITDRVNKKRLIDLTAGFRANIVTARSRAPAQAARAAAELYRLPFVTYFNSIYDAGSEKQSRFNANLASGDRVIVPSQFLADHVQKYYNVPSERLRLIHRGVDLYRYSPSAINHRHVAELRDKLGLVADRPVFAMAGRLSFWKGHHVFIDAIKQVADLNPYGLIFTYGDRDKDYSKDVLKLVRRWGLEDRVRLIDTPLDMATAFSLADVLISASVEPEGFTRSIAEAMCLGKPCIAPNHGSSPEQIIHHETGWLYPPGDVAALVSSIREAMSLNDEQRTNLAGWSMESARAKHDLDRSCDAEIDLFLELVSS